ncbi:hypothetical protein SAMN02745126_05042 [Enhydrobacter aerosaccus]|uniref:Uncharacterized protein n=1 Tax=Enhydrobacter aerosaccus TaxID=225324 RepID=A0A1T4SRJ4_9HYPH|nr:hypothetical protein [Enhydrobacter aerosaccus]SKA30874.1 hypothetical protein SAMN02745126_05042 [Enhydrobacter aerosaccus]
MIPASLLVAAAVLFGPPTLPLAPHPQPQLAQTQPAQTQPAMPSSPIPNRPAPQAGTSNSPGGADPSDTNNAGINAPPPAKPVDRALNADPRNPSGAPGPSTGFGTSPTR